MNFRSFAVLVAVPSLVGGLLISSPAVAAKSYATVSTTSVAISSSGSGKVYLKCSASKSCRGKVSIGGGSEINYAVAAKKAAYVAVKMPSSGNPASVGTPMAGGYKSSNSTLKINEDSPSNVTHSQPIKAETPKTSQQISGTVTPRPGSPAGTDVKVALWRILPGGNAEEIKADAIPNGGGPFSHSVPLGTNNSASSTYELRITGRDDLGDFRSWWWRGGDNAPRGGGRYINEATRINATKFGAYTADFNYGSISGTVKKDGVGQNGVAVTVAAAPSSYSSSRYNRELDFPQCANSFGERLTTAGGNYEIGFLPYSANTDKRYLVLADPRSVSSSTDKLPLWNDKYGSCASAMGYGHYTTNLLNLSAGNLDQDFALRKGTNTIHVNAGYSGFKPSFNGDRFVRIRERIPGIEPLDAPVVASKIANSGGAADFSGLPQGRYWVEVGRNVGCSMWLPSRFSNNNLYLQGADRGAERWKTVSGAKEEYAKSVAMGYVRKTPPKGYKGWAYREQCTATGAGSFGKVDFSNTDAGQTKDFLPTIKRGATVKGHVSRGGGRTNKELLVRIFSRGNTRVMRTDLTDGGGNFSVAGLASGTYYISVNGDSWRGISRNFTGRQKITVTAGKTYRVGTLRFQS